ncbi:MAG: sigma-70 family RNA polymerase sigma factor [Chloroflexi bacterium]|nr:sigma-70 family RNA polymerase sigma factor [Chloroflexota bacterium]
MTALPDNILSDNRRLQRLSTGDAATFEELFHEHYDRVYGLLFRLLGSRAEAEDLAQEVFLKLYHHAFTHKRFQREREHHLGAWLYRVATNMGYNAIRSRRRRWQRNVYLVPDAADGANTEAEVAQRETAVIVRKTLAKLPERQVQLLLLRQMGLSYAECADVCGVAPGSVGTLLARAAAAFRAAYEEEIGGKS